MCGAASSVHAVSYARVSDLTQAVRAFQRLIRIDRAPSRELQIPRNRADDLKIGRIPLTRHAAWSAKFEK